MSRLQVFAESLGLNHQHQQYLSYLLLSSICFWLIVTISRAINRLRSLPNGPWGLPFVGYLPFIKRDSYLQFLELSKKYGPVFSVKLGQRDVVVLNDWPSIKEAFSKEELLARPEEGFFPEIIPHKTIGDMSGPEWQEHRRVAMRVLRDVGFGKSAMENMVREEIFQFISELDKHAKAHQGFDVAEIIGPSVSNNIAILLFGHKFDYDDPEKIMLDTNLDKFTSAFQFAGVSVFLPFLAKILVKWGLVNHITAKKAIEEISVYFGKEIELHSEGLSKNNNEPAIDYIDGYLKEKRSRETRANRDIDSVKTLDLNTLKGNLLSFFGAGSETVKTTLCWAMLLLLKYPEYQEKIRQEIHSVFGVDGSPSYEERPRLPFTMAFLYEIHRYASVIPANLLRRASKDVNIGSHTIPKSSIVIFNFYAVHRDPTLWANPETFQPNRFLTEDGTKVIKPPYLIAFSGGKRVCPGEGLANVELFLYLTTIIQRFRVKSSSDIKISTESELSLSRRPKHLPLLVLEKITA